MKAVPIEVVPMEAGVTGLAERPSFLDQESQKAVGWDPIWSEFSPVTPYGLRWKQSAKPFQAGDEAAWEQALRQLREDAEAIEVESLPRWAERLRVFPDIQEALDRLQHPHTTLSPKHLLALKQFAKRGFDFAVDGQFSSISWTSAPPWERVLSEFGDTSSPTFSIQDVADDEHRRLTKLYTEAMQRAYGAAKRRDAYWFERTGVRPTRDGQIVLALPEHRSLASALKEEKQLTWLRDTPFESVFSLPVTEEMAQAEREAEIAKRNLSDHEERLILNLCDSLRNHMEVWRRLVADVTHLDIRIAKQRLLAKWRGAVPTPSQHIELTGAVHPLVAERLNAQGKAYVPLSVRVSSGANVLCGSNMGGKTVAMSLLFLCQCLAQYALPVPAKAFSTKLFGVLRFSASTEGDLENGLSSFGREVVRVKSVWNDMMAFPPALVCYDEPGRSTNPMEGEAIAVGLVQNAVRIAEDGHVVFIATHFAEATRQRGIRIFQVRGLKHRPFRLTADDDDQGSAMGEASRTSRSDTDLQADLKAALNSDQVGLADQERISALEQAMDYRLEEVNELNVSNEALEIAKWLGMPEDILTLSETFLKRRTRS
jgi:hypothetical protein